MKTKSVVNILYKGLVVGQEKDVSLFLDRTGEPATRHRDSSRLKNKDTSFSWPTTHPESKFQVAKRGEILLSLNIEFTKNLVTLLFKLDFAGLITEFTKKSGHFIV